MADTKISQLPAAAALTGDELLPVVQGGATLRATARALQRVPPNTQSGATYSLSTTDAGKAVRCDSPSPVTLTVPTGIFEAGDVVLVRQVGAGQVSLSSGGTLNVPSGALAKTRVQGSVLSLHCVDPGVFDVSGDLA